MIDTKALEQIANDRADWLVDAVAGSTQNRAFLRGDPEEDEVATESIFLNGKKAISVAIGKACDEIDRLRTEAEPVAWRWRAIGTDRWIPTSDPDDARYRRDKEGYEVEALYARTEADVRVKPLEWRTPTGHPDDPDAEDTDLCADGIGGVYAISKPQKVGPKILLWWAHDPFFWTGFDTPDEANAAAQADYETRIRAALQGGDNA